MKCPVCDHEAPAAAFGEPLRCPECGAYYEKAVFAKARAQPQPPVIERASNHVPQASNNLSLKSFLILCPLAAAAAAALLALVLKGESPSAKAADGGCGSAGMAHVMAGNFVKRELLSPSSAKFPAAHHRGVSVDGAGKCKFAVSSYVDSQNGFGAMIRSHFTVTMQSEPDGRTWKAHNLLIE